MTRSSPTPPHAPRPSCKSCRPSDGRVGVTVDQDEVDVRDVRVGARTAPVERLRLETAGQAN